MCHLWKQWPMSHGAQEATRRQQEEKQTAWRRVPFEGAILVFLGIPWVFFSHKNHRKDISGNQNK